VHIASFFGEEMILRGICLLSVPSFLFAHSLDSMTRTTFQNIIDTASHISKQTGISLGIAFPGKTLSFAAGLKDRQRAMQLQPQDKMGIGSATKSITAAAVLNLVDKGKARLEDLALPHMDALVRRVTANSLLDYFGPTIQNVTVRQLLHMTSGLRDFDSTAARVSIFKHPSEEFDLKKVLGQDLQTGNREGIQKAGSFPATRPFDGFVCPPGSCGQYSSTNYLLLGMILAQTHGLAHWKQYDQSSFLPPDVRRKMPSTVFPLQGLLREFTDVHVYPGSSSQTSGVSDAIDMSANAAFTVANALSTGTDMAVFWQALLGRGSSILSPDIGAEMMKFRWLEVGLGNKISTGQFYGMGVRDMSGQLMVNPMKAVLNPEIFFAGKLYGHDGASAAGYNSFNAYAPMYDFGLSFIVNNEQATGLFNFLTRKIYELASDLAQPVNKPLQAVLENKEAFMSQYWIKNLRRKPFETEQV
jgi:CubicO group peptidase (beta-lactamase class C family)